jgi:hypothetical protein
VLSYHPSVGEAWREYQEIICSKAIVSNKLLLGCEEPNPSVPLLAKLLLCMRYLPRCIFAELPEGSIHEGGFGPNSRAPGFPHGLGEWTITEVSRRDCNQVGGYCDRLVVGVSDEILTYNFPVVGWPIGGWTHADRR